MTELRISFDTPGLAAAINHLADVLAQKGAVVSERKENAAEGKFGTNTAISETEPVKNTEPEKPSIEEKNYTLKDISAAGSKLLDAGKMDALMALLKDFGVQAITMLKEDQYPEFAVRLQELGAAL